jgi:Tfp pilus assembly protein PilZ
LTMRSVFFLIDALVLYCSDYNNMSIPYPGRIDSLIIAGNNVTMGKTTVSYANPNGKIDIRKPSKHTETLSSKFSVNQDSVIGVAGNLTQEGPCPFSEAKDQCPEKVGRETRKEERFPVDKIAIVGEISFADRAEITNISGNGILVNVSKRMDIGKKYVLKICSKEKKIVVMASVVWSRIMGTRRTSTNHTIPIYTAGMEFQDISNGNKKILNELIRHIEASTENRKCQRIPFVEDIMIDGTSWVRSADISEEGIFISSLQALKRDSVVELTIPIGKLKVKAKVQFCDKMVGLGLRFIDLSEEQKTKITELVESARLKNIPDYER